MRTIQNQTFDAERALYGSSDTLVKNCSFDGPADGESAFKECKNVQVEHSFFNLRYPFWHDHGLVIRDSEMTELCRAALSDKKRNGSSVNLILPERIGHCGIPTISPLRIPSSTASRHCGNAAT